MRQRPFLSISVLRQLFDLSSLLCPVNTLGLLHLCSYILKDSHFLLNEANRPIAKVLYVFLEAPERFTRESVFIVMPLAHLLVEAIISRTQCGMNDISIWHRLFPRHDV